MNRLVELMYEEKCGIYLGNDTNDLTADSIIKSWPSQNNPRDVEIIH